MAKIYGSNEEYTGLDATAGVFEAVRTPRVSVSHGPCGWKLIDQSKTTGYVTIETKEPQATGDEHGTKVNDKDSIIIQMAMGTLYQYMILLKLGRSEKGA